MSTTDSNHAEGEANDPIKTPVSGSGCGGGCLGFAAVLALAIFVVYFVMDESDFYLMPGEANQSVEALQKTFDNIDQVLPDSLVVMGELDPYMHYMSAESFENIFYAVNPVLDVAAKADTSRKYKFQYLARVDHVNANNFVIKSFLVDSIWRYEPFVYESKNPFTVD